MYIFNPMSEEEINSAGLLDEGIYNFEVVKSTKKVSRAGNPMAELTLNVWDNEGKQHSVYDYLIFSTIPLNIRKVKHFCDATGLVEEYKKGQVPEELQGRSGKLKIIFQQGQEIPLDKLNGKPPGSRYPDKNAVEDYVMTDKGAVKHEIDPNFDDSVPF